LQPRQQQQDRGGGQNKQWQARNQNLAGKTPLLFFGGLSYNSTEDSIKEAVGYDDVVKVTYKESISMNRIFVLERDLKK
jgi:hypothetical protein